MPVDPAAAAHLDADTVDPAADPAAVHLDAGTVDNKCARSNCSTMSTSTSQGELHYARLNQDNYDVSPVQICGKCLIDEFKLSQQWIQENFDCLEYLLKIPLSVINQIKAVNDDHWDDVVRLGAYSRLSGLNMSRLVNMNCEVYDNSKS